MEIILKRLEVKNFKGVKDLAIDFNPTITQIMGANHTGKTTTADAINWVLFGKNSEGLTVFGIDPKDENNDIIHHLDNSVKLDIKADGRDIVLEKVRKETWKKVKGHDEEELTGHTTDCFIDGNKYTAQDYQAEISNLISESLFKAITNPAYFPKLKADDQRELLIRMVGERSVEEVAGENEDFKAIIKELSGTDLKEFRTHLSYKMKELKKSLEAMPSRISENQNWINSVTEQGLNFEAIRKEIADIEEKTKACDEQIKDLSTVSDDVFKKRSEQRSKINSMKKDLQDMVDKVDKKNQQLKREWMDDQADLESKIKNLNTKKAFAEEEKQTYSDKLRDIAKQMQDFRDSWESVENETFSWDETKETCPTCGQYLPSEQVEELKAKAEQQFNERHQKAQDDLDKRAETLKRDKASLETLMNGTKEKIATINEQITKAEELLEDLKKYGCSQVSSVNGTTEYITLKNNIEREEKVLDDMIKAESNQTDGANRVDAIEHDKQELSKRRDELRDKLVIEGEITSGKKRIKELQTEQKNMTQQLTELEKQDYQAEALEHATIDDLQTRVNELFEGVEFEMFQTQLNGNVKPTCILTMHGVPYSDLSNSEKINAGIDLINAMCRFNDTYAPIIIDNAESVNDILPSRSQQISLNVSRDPRLTVIA